MYANSFFIFLANLLIGNEGSNFNNKVNLNSGINNTLKLAV